MNRFKKDSCILKCWHFKQRIKLEAPSSDPSTGVSFTSEQSVDALVGSQKGCVLYKSFTL